MTIQITQIKKLAKKSLKGHWGLTVLLTFIIFLLNFGLPFIIEIPASGGFSNWANQESTPVGIDIFEAVLSILLIPLSFSVYWFYLNLIRDNEPQISQVFSIYKNGKTSLKLIGLSILQGIYILLWSLLLLIPGMIKSLSYSQTYFLLKDHPEYTVNQAITESKKRMKGYKWKYFLMGLSFIGWGILCIFTLGIGLLWLVPYISTSVAVFYNELIASQDFEDSSKKEVVVE